MKKNGMGAGLLTMMALASMGMEGMNRTSSSDLYLPPLRLKDEPTTFVEEEGIQNMIRDFRLIQEGNSKKSPKKQQRIKSRIQQFLDSGKLKPIDLL